MPAEQRNPFHYLSLALLMSALTLAGCSSGGSDDDDEEEILPPGPVEGTAIIDTSGGRGGRDGGSGGGGNVDMYLEGGPNAIEILRAGEHDADFTMPMPVAVLGDNALLITADTTIPSLNGTDSAQGTPYMEEGNTALYISDGNGTPADETPVTGLSIAAGVTLTFGLNFDIDPTDGTFDTAQINLVNDLENLGTITTEDTTAALAGNLSLNNVGSYIGSGDIDLAGSQAGQFGGDFDIDADYSIFNSGAINLAGSDGSTGRGGDGGDVDIYAEYQLLNSGDIDTSAGGSPADSGGNGGDVDMATNKGPLFNSGAILASGGDADAAFGGGNGGDIDLSASGDVGELRNAGTIDTRGGSSTGDSGGSGGGVNFVAYGKNLINNADLITRGGNSTDSASSGGNAGSISLDVNYNGFEENNSAGSILLSGSLDASGGNAVRSGSGSGGSGGSIDLTSNYDDQQNGEERFSLLGYVLIDTSGGTGNSGGSAGDVSLEGDYEFEYTFVYSYRGPGVVNEADIDASGGRVPTNATNTPAYGGNGGYVEMVTNTSYAFASTTIDNSGDIDASGGDNLAGTANNGDGGDVYFWGFVGVNNSSDIDVSGGDDPNADGGTDGYGGDGGDGGDGGYIEMLSELGPVENSGALTARGGDGEYAGGNADHVELLGDTLVNSGAIVGDGGDADPGLSGSTGGNSADPVELFSADGLDGISDTGSVSNVAGDGETAGTEYEVIIGGLCLSGDC